MWQCDVLSASCVTESGDFYSLRGVSDILFDMVNVIHRYKVVRRCVIKQSCLAKIASPIQFSCHVMSPVPLLSCVVRVSSEFSESINPGNHFIFYGRSILNVHIFLHEHGEQHCADMIVHMYGVRPRGIHIRVCTLTRGRGS